MTPPPAAAPLNWRLLLVIRLVVLKSQHPALLTLAGFDARLIA
jgi:hypothetical protein